jgi:hypothetical protein
VQRCVWVTSTSRRPATTPRPLVARASPFGGFGTRLSRPIQVISDSGGRALLRRRAICGAKRHARESRTPRRAVAVEQFARWLHGSAADKALLAAWPLPRKPGLVDHVNAPLAAAELQALQRCVKRGRPFGDESWTDRAVDRLGLETTLRPQGRPKKPRNGS